MLGIESLSHPDSITSQLFTLFTFTMVVSNRTSSAVRSIDADILRGAVNVEFNNGSVYEFINVSRRAIANLLLQPNMSLGFWVNANCL